VARSFSGDKAQLVSLIKAGIAHRGFALIDVISPCVSFNDHKGSTKSYAHTYQYYHKAVHADYVPPSEEITAAYDEGETMPVELHDGGSILLRKLDKDYDPTNRASAMEKLLREPADAGDPDRPAVYRRIPSGDGRAQETAGHTSPLASLLETQSGC
jgi:2-oxoglutarate ferredoxin oxidoreductase subunit beta